MPDYGRLRNASDEAQRSRTLDRLLDLRRLLRESVGVYQTEDKLLLATWNLRDFDSGKFGHGRRLDETFYYIAEIVSFFDLVAIQEVNRDLKGLRTLMSHLGANWDFIATDTTEGTGGNEERLAFVFDRRKVRFRNLAGEVVLPTGQEIVTPASGAGGTPGKIQFARSPFIAAFQAGWFKFNLCTVHLYYGKDSGAEFRRRVEEIAAIARFFARRQDREQEDYILLGDFNIVDPTNETMRALSDQGFIVPEPLQQRGGSNLAKDKFYDQIAFRVREKRVECEAGGVLDYFTSVFRDNDADYRAYFDSMPSDKRDTVKGKPATEAQRRAYYAKEWRTWQMSDHFLLWVAMKVDFTDAYLSSLKPGEQPLT